MSGNDKKLRKPPFVSGLNRRQTTNRPIELLLQQPYYDMVATGEKTIEGRVAFNWLERAKVGMRLDFKHTKNDTHALHCSIDWLLRSESFEKALPQVDWRKAIPQAATLEDALSVYKEIYSDERVQELGGVILIGFTTLGAMDV